jgi:DNA-directed RNA polymerase subunit RPC12/RpoP
VTIPAPTSHQTYPCGNCGAQLQFAPGTTALACPYCGARQEIVPQQRQVVEHEYAALAAKPRRNPQEVPPNLFVCTGCQAHTESDAWSDVCQFCGAPVVTDQFDPNLVAPEGVLPFQLDKSGARKALQEWVSSRWFAPNAFKKVDEAESLKSTYLPHWTWDAATTSHYRGERGEHYYVERDGKRERRTKWRNVQGTVQRRFDDVVVPATAHVSGDYLDDLSKDWDTKKAVAFQPQYLSGHFTQRYDLGPDQSLEAAKRKMAPVIRKDVERHIGGDAQRVHHVDTRYADLTYKLLLLPVWLLAYLFNGKTWQVLVSGQTGKVEGERPWSAWKIIFAILAALIVIAGIVYLIYTNQ